ncbi:hypothetical protein QPK87_09715 [Kamptonema cortianum]|nr:hypothetical protein [Geitlerinema splendidum]MDK3156851.1 hypothetical protein [Kamptonema cortianum]
MTEVSHRAIRNLTSGKVHWMVIGGLLAIVAVIVILTSGKETPQIRAAIFMNALARGDAETLAKSSYSANKSEEEILAAWKQSVSDSEFYRFKYEVKGAALASQTEASVRLMVWRNYSPDGYDEPFQLKMKKVNGEWKVELESLSRAMYPFLPR